MTITNSTRTPLLVRSPARSFRFGLRTVFLLTTILCLFAGYYANWIHQRRSFLNEQAARWQQKDVKVASWWEIRQVRATNITSNAVYCKPPGLLRVFGVRGYHRVYLLVPPEDTHLCFRPADRPSRFDEFWMNNQQPDYVRAKRLFPEAEIAVFSCHGVGGNALTYPVIIRDSETDARIANLKDKR
jgi:hypothetical protein